MLEKFVTAKHWQLFILTTGVVIVAQSFFMYVMLDEIASNRQPNITVFFTMIPLIMIIALIAVFTQFGWYYAVVIKMHQKIPDHLKMNLKRFKIFFFFPLIYLSAIFLLVTYMFFILGSDPASVKPHEILPFVAFIIPMHFFTIFCIIHTFYCVGKSVKLAELHRQLKFEDYAGEFFLTWFFPIGVWIIQPKINKIWSGEIQPKADSTFSDSDPEIL